MGYERACQFWKYQTKGHQQLNKSIGDLILCLYSYKVFHILSCLHFHKYLVQSLFGNNTFRGLKCHLMKFVSIFILHFPMFSLWLCFNLFVYLENLEFWNEHLFSFFIVFGYCFFIENVVLSNSIVECIQIFHRF